MYLHLSPSENNAALERLNTRAFTKIQKWDAVQEYMNAGGYSCAEIVVRGPSSPKENCRCLVSFHGCWNEVLTYANKYVSNFCLLSLINIQWIANFANKYGVEDIVWKSYWDLFPPDYPKISPDYPKMSFCGRGRVYWKFLTKFVWHGDSNVSSTMDELLTLSNLSINMEWIAILLNEYAMDFCQLCYRQ